MTRRRLGLREVPIALVAPYPLAYPGDGQINVPRAWGGGEYPDPIPAGAKLPVGYPISLQGVGGTLNVDTIELRDPAGQPVAVHPNPSACRDFNCYVLIPVEPLRPGTTYALQARGAVGTVPFDRAWRFTTVARPEWTKNAVFVPVVRNGAADPTFGGTWQTGLQILNLDQTKAADVRIHYVAGAGTPVAQPTAVVAAGKSQTFFGDSLGAPAGFSGSAIVESDVPIAVIVNELSPDTGQAASFNGSPMPALDRFEDQVTLVPIAVRNVNGTSSSIYLQNQGAGLAYRVRLAFIKVGDRRGPTFALEAPLAPGATYELPETTLTGLGEGWQGSAYVASNEPVAVVVRQSNGRSLQVSTGRAVLAGGPVLYGPLVMNNNGGFSSSIQVQSATGVDVNVTIRLFSSATGAKVAEQTRTLGPAAATTWTVAELVGNNDPFVGSITVDAGANNYILGVVSQANPGSNQSSAYDLFTRGTATVIAPLVQTANSGWDSGFQIQNVGTTPATVTVTVTDTNGNRISSVPSSTRTIPPGKSETWFPITQRGVPFVGSAIASGPPGSQLVGIVNQLKTDAGPVDFFTTYEAIN